MLAVQRQADPVGTRSPSGSSPAASRAGPGRPGTPSLFGSAPNVAMQPRTVFVAVPSSTCVSRPITGSYAGHRVGESGPASLSSSCQPPRRGQQRLAPAPVQAHLAAAPTRYSRSSASARRHPAGRPAGRSSAPARTALARFRATPLGIQRGKFPSGTCSAFPKPCRTAKRSTLAALVPSFLVHGMGVPACGLERRHTSRPGLKIT